MKAGHGLSAWFTGINFPRERCVGDGILEKGVVGLNMPEFDLERPDEDDYFSSAEWGGIIGKWEGYVRAVVDSKGNPPQLY
jgi:hypothetical protein